MTKSPLLAVFIAGFFCSFPVAAKMYKWVDDKGRTHYSEVIPPEYANKDRQILNKSGVVIKTQDVLTPEEKRAREVEAKKTSDVDESAREQKLHDKSLTDTYSNVNEIELSRSRSIQQIDARIDSLNSQLKPAKRNLEKIQNDAPVNGKAGTPALQSAQDHVNALQADIEKYKAERTTVNERFDADKARYQELTGK